MSRVGSPDDRFRPAVLAIALGTAVIASVLNLPELRHFDLLYLLPLGALLVPLLALFVNSRSPWMFAVQGVIATAAVGLLLPEGFSALKSDTSQGAALLCLACGLVLLVLLCRVDDRHSWQENWPMMVPVAYTSFILALATPGESGSNLGPERAGAIFAGLVLIAPAALSRYSALIDDELMLADNVSHDRQLPGTRTACKSLPVSLWTTWLALVSSGIAIIASLIIVLSRTSLVEWVQGESAGPPSFLTGAALLALCMGAAVLLAIGAVAVSRFSSSTPFHFADSGNGGEELYSEVSLLPSLLVAAGCVVGITGPWVTTIIRPELWLTSVWLIWPVSLVVAIVAGSGTFGCIRHNSAQIEFLRHGHRSSRLILLCSLAVASTTVWLFVAGIWQGDEVAKLSTTASSLAIVALGQVALAGLVTLLVFDPGVTAPSEHLSLHSPAANVAHDHIHQSLLLLGAVAIIYFFVRVLEIFSDDGALFLAAIETSPVFVFLGIASAFFGRIERETLAHVERERRRMSSAILARFGGRAAEMNQRRVEVIAARFKAQLNLTRWFLVVPQLGRLLGWLDRLIFPRERDVS